MTNTRRIFSLDVLRGVAIMIMLFVDAPPAAIAYPIFIHAPWDGLTFADFAFPGFVFAMGMSAAVSMSKRSPSTRKILTRAALLFALGIFLNTLPAILEYILLPNFTAENFFYETLFHGRPMGILQRLALTYVLGIFIARAVKNDAGIFIAAFVLLICSSIGYHVYAPENPFDINHNLGGAIDLKIFGANHIYTPTHDPEGLYGTIACTASFLFGFLAGKILIDNAPTRDKIFSLTAAGVGFMVIGLAWTKFDIVAKNLWTSPFALITSAAEIFLLAALIYLFENFPRTKKFFHPFAAAGMNPLFMFVFVCVIFFFLNILPSPVEGTGVYIWFFQRTFAKILSPEFGSMIFCALWCLIWLPFAEILYRRGIVIKL